MKKIMGPVGALVAGMFCVVPSFTAQTYSYERAYKPNYSVTSTLDLYNTQGARNFRFRATVGDPSAPFDFAALFERVTPAKTYFWHAGPTLFFGGKTYFDDWFTTADAEIAAGFDRADTVGTISSPINHLLVDHTEGPVWSYSRFAIPSDRSLAGLRAELAQKGGEGYLFLSLVDESTASVSGPADQRLLYKHEVPQAVYDVEVETLAVSDLASGIAARGARGWRYAGYLQSPSSLLIVGYVFWRRRGEADTITYHVVSDPVLETSFFTPVVSSDFLKMANDEGARGFRFVDWVRAPDFQKMWALFADERTLGGDTGPTILTQPASATVVAGSPVTLRVDAGGAPGLTYRWRRNGTQIQGATGTTFTIAATTTNDAGIYDVMVSNSTGPTVSTDAKLTVLSPASGPGRITNVSILTSLSSGEAFTMGFVVGGIGTSGTKPILVRAAGPALDTVGVSGTVGDPRIELFAGSTKTGENDNWNGSAAIAAAATSVGAFPFGDGSSKDAAALISVPRGDNSVRVSANNGGSGMVLAEVYDTANPSQFSTSSPRLINVSVLKDIGAGLTVGFVIGGAESKTILVRAVGPTLAASPFNVPGTVSNPKLTLFAGTNRLAENDDWTGAAVSDAFSHVGAFVLPVGSRDAALVATLPPGNYSAQVTGDGVSGMALVELYEVP